MAVEYLGLGEDDGTNLGRSTSHKIGFYGLATPIVQRSGAAQDAVTTATITAVATAASTTAAAAAGYATKAQADAIVTAINSLRTRSALTVTLVNELRAAQVALNLIKGSS